jgi:hypothetical protein
MKKLWNELTDGAKVMVVVIVVTIVLILLATAIDSVVNPRTARQRAHYMGLDLP